VSLRAPEIEFNPIGRSYGLISHLAIDEILYN